MFKGVIARDCLTIPEPVIVKYELVEEGNLYEFLAGKAKISAWIEVLGGVEYRYQGGLKCKKNKVRLDGGELVGCDGKPYTAVNHGIVTAALEKHQNRTWVLADAYFWDKKWPRTDDCVVGLLKGGVVDITTPGSEPYLFASCRTTLVPSCEPGVSASGNTEVLIGEGEVFEIVKKKLIRLEINQSQLGIFRKFRDEHLKEMVKSL